MMPKLSVTACTVTTRPVGLRLPFRYGVVTLRQAQEAQVSVRIRTQDGKEAAGHAAELLAPKWFDKSPELSNENNVQQLLRAVDLAKATYLDDTDYLSAFGLHAAHDASHVERCATEGLNGLVAGFGNALLDKAILSALCNLLDTSFFDVIGHNAIDLQATTAPDMDGFDFKSFLAGLTPSTSILARHTVGLVDAIFESDVDPQTGVNDGLPESLEAAIKAWGLRAFKIKVSGDREKDIDHLVRIASLLDTIRDPYLCTLDGNEQYHDADAFGELYRAMANDTRLDRLMHSIAVFEQPIARTQAMSLPLGEIGEALPIEIDESDNGINAFVEARAVGYRGVSSKSCKGVYRALINRARVAKWNAQEGAKRYFLSAEDLSTQPGLAVQQDLSLVALLGCNHVERNGHFYGDGVTGLPTAHQQSLKDDVPSLYCQSQGKVHLDINQGSVDLRSLQGRTAYGRKPAAVLPVVVDGMDFA
ncbi:MAG: mandelate racemase [Hyphomicrobiales bacterium]